MEQDIEVLHVDDSVEFAEVTAEYLESERDRFSVETAGSPGAALDVLRDRHVDCVVSDFDMGEADGLEFLESVRDEFPGIPFILYTGHGSEEIASEAISRGVTDYLRKRTGAEQYAVLANRIENAVSERRARARTERVKRQFRKLVEKSTDAILVVDGEGTVQFATTATTDLLGRPPDELVGEPLTAFVHPDTEDEVAAFRAAMVSDGTDRATAECRYDRGDGDWVWVEMRGRDLRDDPDVEGVVVYVRDVTTRREHERAISRERDRLSSLFRDFPEPVLSYEFEGGEPVIRAVNDAFEAVFGYDEERAAGASVNDLIVPSDRQAEAEDLDERVRDGAFVDTELRRETASGVRDFWFRNIQLPPEDDADGFAVYIDITERKAYQRELIRQNARLEEFTSVLSHDLRNPLSVAEGNLELAREACDSPHLDDVADAHDRIGNIIEDVLVWAREGQRVEATEPVALADVVAECWESVRTREATLDAACATTVECDPDRTRRLFENLFRNAVEHAGPDATVTVGDLPDRDGFYVADDGPGVPEDERDRVFDPGYTTRQDGTGMGLSIVEDIAEAHEWDIEVAESGAGGARFEVTGVDCE